MHQQASQLREAIYQTFAGLADGQPAPTAALDVIEDTYGEALHHAHLRPLADDRLQWRWPDRGPLDQVLWPIARSAVELAVSDQLDRIKQCPGDDGQCGWLFVDTTKNGTRCWCSTGACGNRGQRVTAKPLAAAPLDNRSVRSSNVAHR